MDQRDIVIFDIESTGIDVNSDRIVELAMMKCTYDFKRKTETFRQRFNPEMPISPGASEVHKITDEMVKDEPLLKDKASKIVAFIGECNLGTFNGNKFDIPMFIAEMSRCGIHFSVKGRKLLDFYKVFAEKEKRDLTAALLFYCNKVMEDAHEAGADVDATFEIAKGQMDMYDDLNTIEDIDVLSGGENRVDVAGFMEKVDGVIVFAVGKHKGTSVQEAYKTDPGYFKWLDKNSPKDTRDIVSLLTCTGLKL